MLVAVAVTHELLRTAVATVPPATILTTPLTPPVAEPSLPPQRIVVHGDGGLGALGGGKMYSISTEYEDLTRPLDSPP